MKKILFFVAAALLVANHSFAQYKPEKGAKTVDLNDNNMTEVETNDNSRTTNVGFYIEPVLRLGWTF